MKHDALLMVRSGLVGRIDEIIVGLDRLSRPRLCDAIDAIRHEARMHGMIPLERLASTLASALAIGGLGPLVLTYLELMRDAVACAEDQPDASAIYMAALALRTGR